MSELIVYTTEGGRSQIKLQADQQTVWLTQLEMAELFDATKQNISLHLKNVFSDKELGAKAVVKKSLTTAADGKQYQTQLYNLDAILAVGYRVRAPTACSSAAGHPASRRASGGTARSEWGPGPGGARGQGLMSNRLPAAAYQARAAPIMRACCRCCG
jgi:hypothetical protein